ncbi:unnamed protein product [Boreogadus saida]
MHESSLQAKTRVRSAVAVHCKVLVNVLDTNDNAPEVILTSVSTPVQEDAPPGTVIAVISVTDRDSGENGNVDCEIPHHVPFQLHSSFKNYYTLVTSDLLDREAVEEYNITVTARGHGHAASVHRRNVVCQVADVNDNEPRLQAAVNAYLSYSLLDGGDVGGMPVSTYVSVNSDNGNVYALRSFDHERLRSFQVTVQAQDAGLPPLRSNVSVDVFVLDQNDNAPVVAAADAGFLVGRVGATDADSGQNSRLFYQVLQATDPGLFSVALYTGEIRTNRRLVDTDAASHRLLVLVKDNGQPPLSATAAITLSLVDGAAAAEESRPDLGDLAPSPYHYGEDHAVYWMVSLGAVSLTCLGAIVALLAVKGYRDRRSDDGLAGCGCCGSREKTSAADVFVKSNMSGAMTTTGPSGAADGAGGGGGGGGGPISQVYCYKMCLTPESSKSDFMFLKPCSPVMSAQAQNNARGKDYLTSGWSAPERNELVNNATPNEFKDTHKDWTLTKNLKNSAYKRYSSVNMETLLPPHLLSDGMSGSQDEFSCSVAPQYWTWGNHMRECKISLQEERVVPDYSWTTKTMMPQSSYTSPDYQHNVHIPGAASGYCTLKPRTSTPRGELDVYNSFSTFGKKKRLLASYEQTVARDAGLMIANGELFQ